MKLSEQQLAGIAIVSIGLLLFVAMQRPAKCDYVRRRPVCVKRKAPVLVLMEGSMGPTPYRNYGVRSLGKTDHFENKTRTMWKSSPSQAKIDDQIGMAMNKITSDTVTPLRAKKNDQIVGKPKVHDAILSHV